MEKLFMQLKNKCSMVNMANLCALAMVLYTVNATCAWAHHQPEVPEEALKFRKF